MNAYLDHAASSPVRPEAAEAAARAMRDAFGNPSSIHSAGRAARRELEDAREKIAQALGCGPREIVFTASATEANNLAVLGTARRRPGSIATTAVEHPSVLEAAAAAEREGRRVTRAAPGPDGRVDAAALDLQGASLVSMMMVNNEVGALQPVVEAAVRAREAGVLVHTDAVQALGKFPIDLRTMPVDLMTISSHKIGGPKGAGALFVRRGAEPAPLISGGGQEFGLRAGTENAAAAAGFAAAVQAAARRLRDEAVHMERMTSRLERGIIESVPGVARNGPLHDRAPHILNLSFSGADGEALSIALDLEGVAVSTGSACASAAREASHVLLAMGLDADRIRGSIRFSVGPSTTEAEIDAARDAVRRVVTRLRGVSGWRP